MIPEYINCKNKEIFICPYYMHEDCKETCAYARDIMGLGVGAMILPIGKLEKITDEESL